MEARVNADLLDEAEARALKAKQREWALTREEITKRKPSEIPPGPEIRGIHNYPIGQFKNIARARLKWVEPNSFEFIPKQNAAFEFVRSNGDRVIPENFFTDGGSIPRLLRWSDELDPFGSLPAYLLHDWEFDLDHCERTTKSFKDVNSTLMEALRTLMELGIIQYNAFVFWMIETGVNSWVARAAWDRQFPVCPLPPHRPE
jgi:hypothetical protein